MAMIENQKQAMFQKASDLAVAYDSLLKEARALASFFHDNGMGSGGVNELVDADLEGTEWDGVTASQMKAACVTVQEAFATWYDGAQMPIMAVVKKKP